MLTARSCIFRFFYYSMTDVRNMNISRPTLHHKLLAALINTFKDFRNAEKDTQSYYESRSKCIRLVKEGYTFFLFSKNCSYKIYFEKTEQWTRNVTQTFYAVILTNYIILARQKIARVGLLNNDAIPILITNL